MRDMQIDPALYYPPDYSPELLEEWPVNGDLVVPLSMLPQTLGESRGAAWRQREENLRILRERQN